MDGFGRLSLLVACEYAHLECSVPSWLSHPTWLVGAKSQTITAPCRSSTPGLIKSLYRRGVVIHKPAPLVIRCPSGKTSCKIAFNLLAAAVMSGSSEVFSCLLQLGVTDKKNRPGATLASAMSKWIRRTHTSQAVGKGRRRLHQAKGRRRHQTPTQGNASQIACRKERRGSSADTGRGTRRT